MKIKTTFFALIMVFMTTASQAQLHQSVLEDETGNTLLSNLVTNYKPSNVLNYSMARDTMFDKIDRRGDSLYCIYSGHRLYLPHTGDPTSSVYMGGSNNGINTEHVYPRSKGAQNGNAKSDMHHLFPTRIRVNSARGSLPFGDIPDSQTNLWFIKNMEQSNIPTVNIDGYSELFTNKFEPREEVKGNIARAMFYFYTMYKSQADAADATFFSSQKEQLCEWHYADPVDEEEWNRTFAIAQRQSGKPNPFVLDCSLATRAGYCSGVVNPICTQTVPIVSIPNSKEVYKISPNPVRDILQIKVENKKNNAFYTVQVLDITGKEIASIKSNQTLLKIPFSSFPKGMLLLQIKTANYQKTIKTIHQ